jgi:trehalose 6-phosphate synthase/phosphatase
MRGALHVNPWKISEIANAFRQALLMSDDERMRRLSCASEFVTRVTTQRWALAVMLDLKGVHKSVNPIQYSGAGLGLGYRLLGMDVGFVSLDFGAVAKAFKNSRNRLILFDYGGTITSNENLDNLSRFRMVKTRKAHSEPTEAMIRTIRDLCSDKKNTVFVVSGKERHSLLKSLGQIPRLGLAAEHGMFISWPTAKTTEKRHWETLVPITDRTWRSLAMAIMEVYTSRTHGSYIEETEMKVLWQYRDADLEFGYLQARELEDHLSNVLRSYPVDILHGGMEEGGYVEVRPKGVNKGVFAMKLIRNFDKIFTAASSSPSSGNKIDFALVLGDDHCDEPMLSVVRQIGRRVHDSRRVKRGEDPLPELPMTMTLVDVSGCDEYLAPNLEVFTCTVGKKPSAAANYLHDVTEVQELLDALVKVSTRDHRYYSSIDLHTYAQEQGIAIRRAESPSSTVSTGFGQKTMSLDHLSASGDPATPGGAGVIPPISVEVGDFSGFGDRNSRPMSASLIEYLGAIDDANEDDNNFF